MRCLGVLYGMPTPLAVGGLIRERMAPMTPTTLAAKLGVSRMTLYELLNDKRRVTVRTATQLAKHLGGTPAWWMDRQRDIDLHRLKK